MKIRTCFCLFFLFSLSCTKKTLVSKSNKSSEKITEYSEDLSMFRPKYNLEPATNASPNQNSTEEPTQEKKASQETKITSDSQAVNEILKQMAELNSQINEGQGFRIQVFSGNSKLDFENAKSYLYRFHSDLELYESYTQPTYRIRVGDFMNRNDAEKQMVSLKAKFGTVRIISDKINIKKALEIK